MHNPFTFEHGPCDSKVHPRDHDIRTAKVWTAHFDCESLQGFAQAIMRLGVMLDSNPSSALGAAGGDSWLQWCEEIQSGEDYGLGYGSDSPALHITFWADGEDEVQRRLESIARGIGISSWNRVALSAAGDWAEQVSVRRIGNLVTASGVAA